MDAATVVEKLVQMHKDIQVDCGFDPAKVQPDCKPLDDLEGFDSMLVPGAIRALARILDRPLPKGTKIKNLYVTEDGKQKRSLKEIANEFCRTYGKESK